MKDVVSNLFCGPTQQHKYTVPAPRTGNHFLSIQEQVSVQVTFPANRKNEANSLLYQQSSYRTGRGQTRIINVEKYVELNRKKENLHLCMKTGRTRIGLIYATPP